MKRLIILLLVLIGLSTAAYFLWKGSTSSSYKDTFADVEHTQFAVENAKEVLGRIFLADREGNQALFEKGDDGQWVYTNKVTGKSYRPSPNALGNLLEAIEKVRARNRVPKASKMSVLKGIGTIGVKVELYDQANKLIRTYYVGGPADAGQATFAVMDGSEIPYVVYIPSFAGTIDTRFTAKEKRLRDKSIVRLNPDKLEMVQVEYLDPMQRPYSFKLEIKSKGKYEVEALYENPYIKTTPETKVKNDHVEAYLDDFRVFGAERHIYDKNFRDSILRTSPFARVSYQLKGKELEEFSIYPLINPNFDRGDGRPGIRQKVQRYYVDVDEDHFYMAQDLVMRKALRPFDFFMEGLDDRREEVTKPTD
jgi:hypothetical protein